jgi:ribosomal protein S18 acetylase RimI-like enzyme
LPEAPLARDAWLGEILGCAAWRVSVGPQGPDRDAIGRVGAPAFLYAKVPTADTRAVASLDTLGFHVVDTNVTLERNAAPALAASGRNACRFARSEDRAAVRTLAGRAFSHSRLHLDTAVPREAADRSRAEWAANFFAGARGDHMVVAESGGACTGFLQLLGPAGGVLTIDLIGVDPAARRRGVARDMIAFAAAELPGIDRLRVGTQVANIPSLGLYEALGFRVVETTYVLHCHRH